ncbi:MAG: FAD-dependent oxidoreductase [ANME-2 cluster archaeon]|nr:FAD-dependent oxidoreductase [ANME-2 cluster archaeon]
MTEKNIVIVGLGVGGFSALMAAKRISPESHITIVERRNYDMFSPCGLPFVIEGIIPDSEDLKHILPTGSMGVEKLLLHELHSIDAENKVIKVEDLATGTQKVIVYDSLILATGSEPFIPPVPGARELLGRGVYTLSSTEDTNTIREAARGKKHAVVMGAGPIGLEVAVALKAIGLDVVVVEMLGWAFPKALDKDMASAVSNALKSLGIRSLMGKAVEKVIGEEHIEAVEVGGETLDADLLVAASGVRADHSIMKDAGIEIGRFGITTNRGMMTNIKDIFAAGDSVEVTNPLSHKPWSSQLANSAYRQGAVAGTNAAGGYATYEGSLTTFVSVVGDLEVAATGFNSFFAAMYGFNVVSGKAKGKTRPDWYPGAEDISVKVLADSSTGKLLGAQAVGKGAAARINVVAVALKGNLTVHELAEVELAYCPAVSETYDVLTKACDFAVRKLNK